MSDLTIEQLWSVNDVCKFLGVKRSWVYAQVAEKELPHLRLSGQCIRFDPTDVRRWAASKRKCASNVLPFPGADH